jgi:16S rRNA (adenine1518-N6/adenine1519-N6)-dimethyltransferase
VMLQREVADRLIAVPGTRDYGVLSVLIGHAARVERLLTLPPGAFRPPPKVHSALVQLRFHAPEPPVADREAFVRLVQAVFTRRRKTLANALLAYRDDGAMAAAALQRSGIDGRRRPETLAIAEFARLADAYMSETAGPTRV